MARKPVTLGSEYADLLRDLRSYVICYGGFRKVAYSPYTHLALLTTVACWGVWHGTSWTGVPLAVLPALLGFTLAAYALLLGFGDESFRKFLASSGEPDREGHDSTTESTLMGVSAVFLHFVVVEIVALICAIVGEANPFASLGWSNAIAGVLKHIGLPPGAPHHIFAFFGLFAFNLSIFMALAAAIDIYHATGWYVRYTNKIANPRGSQPAGPERKL